ncbi:hypothetical protein [Cellulosimicrobium sp. NPDC057862]|uniref:hypothetical protein n=1 Tax=Cellulosimicrobium sp. NPDC057862 TaxID=3346266 RepID=UPI003671750F
MPTIEGAPEALDEAIIEAARGGTELALADAADFSWDEVALFHEGTTVDDIESVVGETGIDKERFTGGTDLFVFRDGGQVVRLLVTSPDVFTGDYRTLLSSAAVVAPDASRPGYVRLVDGA